MYHKTKLEICYLTPGNSSYFSADSLVNVIIHTPMYNYGLKNCGRSIAISCSLMSEI